MRVTAGRARAPLLALSVLLLLAGCGESDEPAQSGGAGQQSARPAQVMETAQRDIALHKSYPAKLRSGGQATVVARVRGLLEARHFEPGARVEEGDELYTIEPEIYQATVGQRKADVQSAQAQVNQAQRDAERAQRLRKQNAISERELDQAVAQERIAKASVAQAQAALDSAQIDLGYTRVTAPVSGLIGLSEVNVGNVVSAGTELATITPLDPLEVRFQLPQADAFDLRRQRQSQQAPIKAVLELPGLQGDGRTTLEGQLDFLGSTVDQDTSTVQARALFGNPQGMYLPGQFVRVRIEGLTRYNVLAVPEIAVTQGLMGPQVFTLNEDNAVTTTNVTIGENAGPRVIISAGLKPGARVIVSDPGGIQAGMTIDPQPYDGEPGAISAQGESGNDEDEAEPAQESGQQ